MNIERGFRDSISKHLNTSEEFSICLSTSGHAIYDTCCFGVDSEEKMSDDRYTVFYNQTSSPENAITYETENGVDTYRINIEKIPSEIATGVIGRLRLELMYFRKSKIPFRSIKDFLADFKLKNRSEKFKEDLIACMEEFEVEAVNETGGYCPITKAKLDTKVSFRIKR